MSILVVGATGATGRLLVEQLIERGQRVTVIVRSAEGLSKRACASDRLTIVTGSLLELSSSELTSRVDECSAVASCLGHSPNLRGVFGPPRRLVTDAARKLCDAIVASQRQTPIRLVLMNSAGVRNRDEREPIGLAQRAVIGLLRMALPPHADNEQAADYLRVQIGPAHEQIEWAVVRPDTLVNHDCVSAYETHRSPTRSAIFNPGKTSRVNVAHFMAELMTDDATWRRWKGRMPVIYNA